MKTPWADVLSVSGIHPHAASRITADLGMGRVRNVRVGPPTPPLPRPTRSRSVPDSSFLGHVLSGSSLWVAIRVRDRHPHARHDRGRVWAGHRPVARQRVSPCKRLANTSGPMGMLVLAASALHLRRMPRCPFRNVGGTR
jgi:hypothetical protein